jgi:HD superfamily phosphodiesterase
MSVRVKDFKLSERRCFFHDVVRGQWSVVRCWFAVVESIQLIPRGNPT